MAYTQQSFTVNVNVRGYGVSQGKGDGTGDSTPENENSLTAQETAEQKAAKAKAAQAKLTAHNMKQQGMAALKQAIYGGLQYYVSGVEMTTGDQFLQAKAQKTLNNVELGINMATSAITGAISGGAAFGVIGAVGGAILGVAGAGISRGLEYETGLRQYNFTVWKNNSNINYVRSRADLQESTGRSRVR